jgi:hypothetical protein
MFARATHGGRWSIQRDLLELAEVFPIVVDDRAKPYGWRWADGADALDVPFAQGCSTPRLEVSLRLRRDGMGPIRERLDATCVGYTSAGVAGVPHEGAALPWHVSGGGHVTGRIAERNSALFNALPVMSGESVAVQAVVTSSRHHSVMG